MVSNSSRASAAQHVVVERVAFHFNGGPCVTIGFPEGF